MAPYGPYAAADWSGGGDFLERVCAEDFAGKMESKCGFCRNYSNLCFGAYRVLQFHACDGRFGGGSGVGIALQILPAEVFCNHTFARPLGCGGIRMVPNINSVESQVFYNFVTILLYCGGSAA